MTLTTTDLARKRAEVRTAYDTHGFHSRNYQQAFDELHVMNLQYMADAFRKERGLPPGSKTPYC